MVAEPQLVSAREFVTLPRQRAPIELIGGQVVTSPSPDVEHEMILSDLKDLLRRAADDRGLGRWFQAPLDLFVTPYDVFQPDLMLFASNQLPARRKKPPIEEVPLLVIEVLSPSNRSNDLIKKLPKYASRGISEYWIVDPAQQTMWINVLNENGNYLQVPIGDGPIQVGIFEGLVLPLSSVFSN